jgi:hypothetical protein
MGGGAGDVVVAARPSGDVGFLVLGPLAAVGPTGDVLSLSSPRRRALLAALLVHAGTVLSVDRLIDLLWGARLGLWSRRYRVGHVEQTNLVAHGLILAGGDIPARMAGTVGGSR